MKSNHKQQSSFSYLLTSRGSQVRTL